MPLRVACPSCSATLTAPDAAAGKTVTCPKCQTPMVLPDAPPPVAAPAAARAVRKTVAPARPEPARAEDDRPRKRPRPAEDDANDDENDDRPRRKTPKKRKKGGPNVVVLAVGGVAFLVAAVGGFFAVQALTGTKDGTPVAAGNGGGTPAPAGGNAVPPGESTTPVATTSSRKPYVPRASEAAYLQATKNLKWGESLTEEEVLALMGEPTQRTAPRTVTNKQGQTVTFHSLTWAVPGSGIVSEMDIIGGRARNQIIGLEGGPSKGKRK